MKLNLIHGDTLDRLRELPDASVDAIVTDPPYGLSAEPDMAVVLRHWLDGDDYQHRGGGFMGKSWDSFVPGPKVWAECHRARGGPSRRGHVHRDRPVRRIPGGLPVADPRRVVSVAFCFGALYIEPEVNATEQTAMYYVEATPYSNAAEAARTARALGEPAYYVDDRGRVSSPVTGSIERIRKALVRARRMSASSYWSGVVL